MYVAEPPYDIYRRSIKDFQSPLGLEIEDNKHNELSFYPNLASENILKTPLLVEKVEILDMKGVSVLTSLTESPLSVETLQTGVYMVKYIPEMVKY